MEEHVIKVESKEGTGEEKEILIFGREEKDNIVILTSHNHFLISPSKHDYKVAK